MPYKDPEAQKEAWRRYYKRNQARLYEETRKRKKKFVERNRDFIYMWLISHPCIDCGETDPIVLEFDHLNDKIANVCKLMADGLSLDRLKKEIDKCDVVCSNCHTRRTARRGNDWRYIRSNNG